MECPVCMEIYQTPLLLPGCGHTFCRACCCKLLTSDNFLPCPECRLVHKLAQGIKSLPKNVALAKTIDEYHAQKSHPDENSTKCQKKCDQHPLDEVSLYCKTCDKYICLKCYFSSTLRGKGDHSRHDVDTSQDAHQRELRLLEEKHLQFEKQRADDLNYIQNIVDTKAKLETLLQSKLNDIEKSKNSLISTVKKAAAKVSFTLRGSVASETEVLQTALEETEQAVHDVTEAVDKIEDVIRLDQIQTQDLKVLKQVRGDVAAIEERLSKKDKKRPLPLESTTLVGRFDTDLTSCLTDHKMALAYQTEVPKQPTLEAERCIISSKDAYIVVKINQSVRTKTVSLHYKEAQYKGLSEKERSSAESVDVVKGIAAFCLWDLKPSTMYKLYAISHNDIGSSEQSKEMWFRTLEGKAEIRMI